MPRMIDLIRASAVPSNLMQAAARGALSIPPAEMIEILVHLANHNKVFGEQAGLTLAGWDEASSRAAAADPNTPQEVLEYLLAPRNLRPILLPALLENSAVAEESLVELAATGSREVVEMMLKSERVNHSREILNSLCLNPNLTEAEATTIGNHMASAGSELPSPEPEPPEPSATSGEVLAETEREEAAEPEDVLDESLTAYLAEHAGEISAEQDKPFQPIGGIYEELDLDAEQPLAEAATTTPSSTPAAKSPEQAASPHRPPAPKKHHTGLETERGTALQKIAKLDVKARIQLAMKGNKEERSLLIRDGTKVVALAVLVSPKISDGEVEKFASQRNVLEAVLRGIPLKRRFAKHYGIVRNLVFNPRTPLDVSLGLMKNILVHDLKNLVGNKEVSDTVRKLAMRMFRQKTEVGKKSMD
ncbi:MAG: hypothetical protein LAN63_01915 [Acidobacteriia bacterium]|nr:hypothetical protein [Terriglobia bacterium]